jgi:hypothetical protein
MATEIEGKPTTGNVAQDLKKKLVQQLKEEKFEFFVNSKLQPVVFIPDEPFQKVWPVNSERFNDVLCAVYNDITGGGYLEDADRKQLLPLLRDLCHKGGRRLTEVESEKAEIDPIIQAVLIFLVKCSAGFEGFTRDLLAKLLQADIQASIRPMAWDFPVLTNIFVRKFNRQLAALRGFGVEASVWHEEDGSHCKVIRGPSFSVADASVVRPSDKPSDGSRNGTRGTDPPDDSDGNHGNIEKNYAELLGAVPAANP